MATNSTHVIAEMACSHDGDTDLAKKIIDGAGQSGADAIQFQIWRASDLVSPRHSQFAFHQQLELSRDEWSGLAEYVRSQYEMEIIACVYEEGSLRFAKEIGVDALKIHSSDLSNQRFLRSAAETKLRIDLSVGGSTIEEIRVAIATITEVHPCEIWFMYGIQNFPTPPSAVRLNYMMKLGHLFELPVGYQDHCAGGSDEAFWLPAAAIGMGVHAVEKHITHDRSKKGADHQAALNPDEFGEFMRMVRVLDEARGSGVPESFSADEVKYRAYAKKRVVAARDLSAGETLGSDSVLFMRAEGTSVTPEEAVAAEGRKVRWEVRAYDLITKDDLE